jgi:hypothetical protein
VILITLYIFSVGCCVCVCIYTHTNGNKIKKDVYVYIRGLDNITGIKYSSFIVLHQSKCVCWQWCMIVFVTL